MKNSSVAAGTFYKWEVLALLWFAFFINQADRQVYNTLLEKIKLSLELSDAQAGLIATVFSLVFACCVPLSGFLADKYSKKAIICFSILLWSAATMVSGACTGIVGFIMFRSIATGMGEAAFGPANYSLIADYHDESTRGRAMSIHQTSYYVGVVASGAIAGWIADIWGWRSAFYAFGFVGVLHAVVLFVFLRDRNKKVPVAEPVGESSAKARKGDFKKAVKYVLTTPTAICLIVGFASLIFVLQGYLTWSTSFLMGKFGLSTAEAGFSAMFYTHAAAFFGILLAGVLSDRFAKISPRIRVFLQGAGLLIACPFILTMGLADSQYLAFLGFAGFGFWRAFFDANTYPVLYDVVPARYRASATGILLFLGWGAGSLSPFFLGILKPMWGMGYSIASLSAVWVFGALICFLSFKLFYMHDYNRARSAEFADS